MEKCQIFFVRSLVTIKIYQPKKQLDKNKDVVVNNGQFDLQLSSRKGGEQQNPPKCATHEHLGNTYTIVSYHVYTGHVSSHDQSIHILMQQDLEYKMKHNSPTHPSPIVPEKYISLEITNWGNLQKSETNIVGFLMITFTSVLS